MNPEPSVPVVDAHHHLWDPRRRDYPWLAGAALEPIRRPYTVDDLRSATGDPVTATVLVQTVSVVAETEEFLAAAATSAGLVAGVVGWINLTAPDCSDAIARLRSVPGGWLLAGVRHQVEDEPDPRWLAGENVVRGLRAVGAAGLAYDLLVRRPQRETAFAVAARLPGVRFVLDHAGKPGVAAGEWEPWAGWITRLAALPNVVCKLSGLVTEAPWDTWSAGMIRPYADHVLDRFGADRVMFGSDWPVCELAATHGQVLTLTTDLLRGASPAQRLAVLGGTARRTYLGGPVS